MSKGTRWLVGLALAGIAMLLLWLAVFDWAAWVCRAPAGDTGKPLAAGPIACAEYWINRYQSLLGAMIAALAAALAWYGVQGQIEIARRQASVGLIKPLQIRIDAALRAIESIRYMDACVFTCLTEIEDCFAYLKAACDYYDAGKQESANASVESFLLAIKDFPKILEKLEITISEAEDSAKKALFAKHIRKGVKDIVAKARIAQNYYTNIYSRYNRQSRRKNPWGAHDYRTVRNFLGQDEAKAKERNLVTRSTISEISSVVQRLEELLDAAVAEAERQ